MKTIKPFKGQVSGPDSFKKEYNIPVGTSVSNSPNREGDYWLEDFSMLDSYDKFDAIHYGFRIPPEYVDSK